MADIRTGLPEENASPWFAISMVLIVFVGIAGVSLILSGGKPGPAPGAAGAAARPGGGGGGAGGSQPLPLLPQAPVDTNSPAGDAPPVTIIQDTREMLHRLPLDRNHPKGWTNPSVPNPPGSR